MIRVQHLHKSFRELPAVRGISLQVDRGEMFALVGPDGAGKTTTIRVLCGILPPDTGTVSVAGFDVTTESANVRRRIGYLSQRFSLYGDLSVDENIEFFARIHGVRAYQRRRDELLDFTRLAPFRDRLADRLSGGMKQKLALACTLIHTPEVIFLDEPTTGVDPVTRRDFWKLLAELLRGGTTIFVTTPYMDEAERCTRVALMNNGEFLACDSPSNIRSMLGLRVVQVTTPVPRHGRAIAIGDGRIGDFFDDVQTFGDRLDFISRRGTVDQAMELIARVFRDHGLEVTSMRHKATTIENVFVSLMGSARVDEESTR